MGCDIHMHTEIKIRGEWHHYSAPRFKRCYPLFCLMAAVRGPWDGCEPTAGPRGLPADSALVTRLSRERYRLDGHSDSYLDASELATLEERWEAFAKENSINPHDADLEWNYVGFLEGNSWAEFAKYPDERPSWIEDVRWCFWFDN